MKGLPNVPAYITLAALAALSSMAQADGFMDADTERARLTEANGECQIAGALGADVQDCVSAYLCANFGDCDGEDMRAVSPTPWGVYRDDVGGANGN